MLLSVCNRNDGTTNSGIAILVMYHRSLRPLGHGRVPVLRAGVDRVGGGSLREGVGGGLELLRPSPCPPLLRLAMIALADSRHVR